MRKSNWPTEELRQLAFNAVNNYGGKLLDAIPKDGGEYGLRAGVSHINFFAELLGALAYYESGFDTNETYEEDFKDNNGKLIISRGLLMISIESANGYGAGLVNASELHDPATNLRCAVMIMGHWLTRDFNITKAMSHYWAPFRNPVKIASIKRKMKSLFNQLGEDEMKKRIVYSVPKFGDKGTGDVRPLQEALKEAGFNPGTPDDWFWKDTLAALQGFQKSKGMPGSGVIPADGGNTFVYLNLILEARPEEAVTGEPKWLKEAREDLGKKETDPSYNKEMSAKWKLVGLNLGTISKNWAAWCGLFIAVSLSGAGYQYAKNGAGAKNWDHFGKEIAWKKVGIPQGAIVYINHNAKCGSGSSNHVTFANGSCSAADITKPGAYFAGLGGNQGNKVSINRYPASHICSVNWPNDAETPPAVTVSKDCANANATGGSTQ